jgi:alpha-tubulin suppressor-like RCC1 family protein
VTIAGLPDDVVNVVAGQQHACALDTNGAVLCWGSNTFGQLGIGTGTISSPTPVTPGDLDSGVVALATGHWHTCALLADGSVSCWGNNARNQLGSDTNGNDQWEPTPVAGLPAGVTALSAGLYHTCALTSAGTVWCWGDNSAGQLGDDQAEFRSAAPIQVPGMSGATGLSAGAVYVCVVVAEGVKCWGSNADGALGDGTFTLRAHPVDVVGLSHPIVQVDSAWTHTCAVTEGGGVRCWGSNRRFALGVRHPKHYYPSPVTVRGFRGADSQPT